MFKKKDKELRRWCFLQISEMEPGTESIVKPLIKRIKEADRLFQYIKNGGTE